MSTVGSSVAPAPSAGLKRWPEPVFVTKAFLPPLAEYNELMRQVWENGWVTNHGPMVRAFEKALVERFGLEHTVYMVNGTIALNMAIRALELKGEIITTAFTHPVTTSSIQWENCTPVFVDVEPGGFNIDAARIEEKITPRTSAIMATHVYGLPCDVQAIEAIARKHGLKVIYDGAHAFGTMINGRSILSYGDISTTSYHATKVFHTIEGGSIHCSDPLVHQRMLLLRTMGQVDENFLAPGLNAKASEMHAAMGLANLPYYDDILGQRKHQWQRYVKALAGSSVMLASVPDDIVYNHSYFPAVFRDEDELNRVRTALNAANVFPRRYFRPATTLLPYVDRKGECPLAESLSSRVLCLPLYHGLPDGAIDLTVEVIEEVVSKG